MNKTIIMGLRGAGLGLFVGAVALLGAGCAQPAFNQPTAAAYDYEYYPDLNVYYYPARGTYHWYEDGHWTGAHHAPPRYATATARHERLREHTQAPWIDNANSDAAAVDRPYPWPTPDDFAAHGY